MPDQFLDHVRRVGFHRKLMVISAEPLCDNLSIPRLVVFGFVKADRERLNRRSTKLCHQRDNSAGVYATTQERAQRNIADQPKLYRLSQALNDFAARLALTNLQLWLIVNLPITV